ncbi:MAG TPA: PfkB family carbohydrate kinase [Patescibacteria group bacterium]|nr:PfkB family carbohydrate kinase [Patescibacteria group bacterium]
MNSPDPISLISTMTEDVLLDESGRIMQTSQAGPAFFLKNAFSSESVPFESFEHSKFKVEILVTPEGEFGRTPTLAKPSVIKQGQLKEWTVISSVAEEWQLPDGISLPKYLFVDLQGFVRNGSNFGGKKAWSVSNFIAEQLFCIKGTAEEVRYLPCEVFERQKQKLLIITYGKDGVDVFYKGQLCHFRGKTVTGIRDTVGAGDTFLGHFVAKMYKGASPIEAGENAVQDVVTFLEGKRINKTRQPLMVYN